MALVIGACDEPKPTAITPVAHAPTFVTATPRSAQPERVENPACGDAGCECPDGGVLEQVIGGSSSNADSRAALLGSLASAKPATPRWPAAVA
jgi:hypothetical protein